VDVDEVVEAAPVPANPLADFDPPFLIALRTEIDRFTGDPAARFECRAE
jgi:hypothetical protein